MNKKYVLYFKFLIALFNNNIFAAEINTECLKISKKANVCITHERFLHIAEGLDENGHFSGGHDYGFYAKKHLKKSNQSVFFDTLHRIYIASSTKGESLPEIIDNLQNKKAASYHTLFPAGVLTKEFILQAFSNAYKIKDNQNNINEKEKMFYAKINDFAVTGFFIKKKNNYEIKTVFPDVDWNYRIEFKHNQEKKFALSRFLQWNHLEKYWESYGLTKDEKNKFENIEYFPKPIIYFLNSADSSVGKLDGGEFLIMSTVRNDILNNYTEKELDVLSLFFNDSNNPLAEEVDLLLSTLKIIMPAFSIKNKKNIKLSKIKLDISNFIKNNPQYVKLIRSDDKNIFYLVDETVGNNPHLHFAEEILLQMLLINACSNFLDTAALAFFTQEEYDTIKKAAEKVSKNITEKLVPDEDKQKVLHDKNITFLIRVINSSEYALEIISKNSLKKTQNSAEEYNQMSIFLLKGLSNFVYKISFSALSIEIAQKIAKNGELLNHIRPNYISCVQ